jgi:virginiamycin B lyase
VGEQRIARITPAGVVTTYQLPAAGESTFGFTVGGDGHLWSVASSSADRSPNRVLRISVSGQITEFPLPSDQSAVFSGLVANGGSIWFAGVSSSCTPPSCPLGQAWVDRITPDGTVSEHKVPAGTTVVRLYGGPDGNLYYVGLSLQTVPVSGSTRLGRVTPTGAITEYAVSTARQDTFNLVAGTGKTLWLTGSVQTNEQGSSTITHIALP